MKLTPDQRRHRIQELAGENEEYAAMYAEYEKAKAVFIKMTDEMPREQQEALWAFPGMGYFIYHRMLTLICDKMIFPDEK